MNFEQRLNKATEFVIGEKDSYPVKVILYKNNNTYRYNKYLVTWKHYSISESGTALIINTEFSLDSAFYIAELFIKNKNISGSI